MQMDKKLSGVTFMTINNHSMNISLYPQSFWSVGTGDHKPSVKIFTRLMVVVQLLLSFINVIITVPIRYVSVQRFDTKNLMLHQDSSRWTCSSLHRVMPSLVTNHPIVRLYFNTFYICSSIPTNKVQFRLSECILWLLDQR